jgi:CRISPR/Cas system-associated exonuclease Cas4 (RecB family)
MASTIRVSKRVFLGACSCPTKAWLLRHLPSPEWTEGERFRMQQGNEIGERARRLFPEGVLVEDRELTKAAAKTASLMADPATMAIFEATFLAGDFVARADVLLREGKGWAVLEVKSNCQHNEGLTEDLAYTVNVAQHAGVQVETAKLMLLSPDYRLGMDDGELFQTVDLTDEVNELLGEFDEIWDSVPGYVNRQAPLSPTETWVCKSCEFFETDCIGKDVTNHIFDLPRLRETTYLRLVEKEITLIPAIPADFKLSETQHRVRHAVHTGRAVVDQQGLSNKLASVVWPARYLDFETVATAIPLVDGIGPHASILTQYSIHLRPSQRHECEHLEYLADHQKHDLDELVQRLIRDLGDSGHIVVYSSFEKTRLTQLARDFSKYRTQIKACIDRLFDLHALINKCVYHPEFRGSTSIKIVLDKLTDLSYCDLQVQNGDHAVAAFARLMRGEVAEEQVEGVRKSLLEYCKRDTLAMVKLHDALLDHCR